MRTALDTNILSALLTGESEALWIAKTLKACEKEGPLVICGAVYCEASANPYVREGGVDELLTEEGIAVDWNSSAMFEGMLPQHSVSTPDADKTAAAELREGCLLISSSVRMPLSTRSGCSPSTRACLEPTIRASHSSTYLYPIEPQSPHRAP